MKAFGKKCRSVYSHDWNKLEERDMGRITDSLSRTQENGQVMAPIGPDLVAFNSMGPIGRPRSYSTSHAAAVQHHLQLKVSELN